MNIAVRKATLADLDWLMPQLQAFSDFHGAKKPLYGDGVYAREAMSNLIEKHLVLLAERSDGTITGFIAGLITPHLMNPEIKVLAEMFWWVPTEFRNSRSALLLLNEFTRIGEQTADWVLFTLEHHSPVSDRCLIRRGFKQREQNYLLEVG